jgi:hypothetical protein
MDMITLEDTITKDSWPHNKNEKKKKELLHILLEKKMTSSPDFNLPDLKLVNNRIL